MQKLNIDNIVNQLKNQTGSSRIETGPLQINDDWSGVFIRGDSAMQYYLQLTMLLDSLPKKDESDFHWHLMVSSAQDLRDLLKSCIQ